MAATKRKLIRKFRDSGTTSAENAKTLDELNLNSRSFFRRFVRHEVIIEVHGKYYLDEQKLMEYNSRRRKLVIPLVIFILLLFIIIDIIAS